MKTIKLEEMIINAITNPDKRFTHKEWKPDEYIYWCSVYHRFRGDEGDESIEDYSTTRKGWKEWK